LIELFYRFYFLHLDTAASSEVRIFYEDPHLRKRPLVFIGAPGLDGKISCKHFPGKVGFIHALQPNDANICDQAHIQSFQDQVLAHSHRYPTETVIFLAAGGTFSLSVLHELWHRTDMHAKDVIISVGSVLSTFMGEAKRDFQRNWHTNCEKSGEMFHPDIFNAHCAPLGFVQQDPNIDFSNGCSA
jgi:hypothetical protein